VNPPAATTTIQSAGIIPHRLINNDNRLLVLVRVINPWWTGDPIGKGQGCRAVRGAGPRRDDRVRQITVVQGHTVGGVMTSVAVSRDATGIERRYSIPFLPTRFFLRMSVFDWGL
jgi:hypothetical protein